MTVAAAPRDDAHEATPFRAGVVVCAWGVVLVSCLVLVGGWMLDVALLRSVIPGAVGMKALTAIGLLCAAVSLLLLAETRRTARRRAAGLGLALTPGGLGVLVLAEYAFGVNLGIDELLFVDREGRAQRIAYPGRFAPTTGACFILTTSALLLLDSRGAHGWRPAEIAAVPVALIAGMAILGYTYSLPIFYGPASAAKMAINTAACFLALAVGIVLARPRGRLIRLATTKDPGGVMIRRTAPFALCVPLLLGWLHLRTVERGLLEPEAAAWWLSAATAVGFVVIIAWCSSVLSRADEGRRQLEQATREARDHAIEMSRVKSEFVANMSHEIRTPLNGVIGMTELLLDTPLSDQQREYGEGIRTSGGALMSVIGDILDFSKIEAGALEIEQADFRLDELVHSTCALMHAPVKATNLKLTCTLEDAVPDGVTGDAVRVRQILLNLLSNAVKFTAEGEVRVTVGSHAASEEQALVRFDVADTGIGVSPEALDTLFESFTQADSSTTRSYGGTGLGLAISKQLAELMGGEIGAESALGHGSRFWFTVPFDLAEVDASPEPAQLVQEVRIEASEGPAEPAEVAIRTTDAPAEPAEPDQAAAHSGAERDAPKASFTLLVAEDNTINQLVVRRMLENLGYDVDLVVNGREAVAKHASGRYAAILMDCQMPVLDGYAATREIRVKEATGRHTPIIAMTAHTMEGDREKCLGAGMDDYLGKPLRIDAVKATLARALASSAGPTDPGPAAPGPVPRRKATAQPPTHPIQRA